MNQTPQHLQKGITLQKGKYTILNKLGSGGFGITYKARYQKKVFLDEKFRQMEADVEVTVALKELFIQGGCIREQNTTSVALQGLDNKDFLEFKERFLKEAKTLQKLDGVHQVVNVIDYFEEHNTAYMVMEFVEGKTLKEKVTEKGSLTEQQAVKYMRQITKGLHEIHKLQIIHRDIKPDNIIINTKDEAVLIDFGTAKGFISEKSATHSMIFTPNYASPEQYSQRTKIGPYTDIFALGGTFYYCLTGNAPNSIHDREKGERIKIPGISIPVENLVNSMMFLETTKRLQNARTLLEALDSLHLKSNGKSFQTYHQTKQPKKDATFYERTKELEQNPVKGKAIKQQKPKGRSFFKGIGAEVSSARYFLAHLFLVIAYFVSLFGSFAFTKTNTGEIQLYSGWKVIQKIIVIDFYNIIPSLALLASFLFPFCFLLLYSKRFKKIITIIAVIYTFYILALPFVVTWHKVEWGALLSYMLVLGIVLLFLEKMFSSLAKRFTRGLIRMTLLTSFLFIQVHLINQTSDTLQIAWSGISINDNVFLQSSSNSNWDVRSITSIPNENIIITSGSYITLLDAQKDSVRWKNEVRGSMQAFASPDKKQVIALDSDNLNDKKHTLKFLDIANGKLLDEINLGTYFIRAMALSTAQNSIALGGFDKRISLLDIKTKKIIKSFTTKNLHNVLSLSFNASGDTLVSGHTNLSGSTLYMWDVKTGKVIKAFNLSKSVYDVKYSPDGKLLAAATKKGIYIFETKTGTLLRKLEEEEIGFRSIDFHPTKPLLASAGQKGTNDLNLIHVWNPLTGKVIRRIDKSGTAVLYALIFKNEEELVTSNYRGETTIWQLNIFKN
ncbi:protein kinase domain-containing protein [Ascidiimonas sp. W6]|uniref:protein kinase domain-containing protein n=1 Tax=Ascidiimonas meishanensis TaxID=3128903 RepID=UPI0030ECA6B1